jgi:hypothetical protein
MHYWLITAIKVSSGMMVCELWWPFLWAEEGGRERGFGLLTTNYY